MKMCDRCQVPGCLLDYRGKACEHARREHCPEVVLNNAEYITGMDMEELAAELVPIVLELCKNGTPSEQDMIRWLKQPNAG